ncbi:MAG TPA: hypothetical protein VKB35_15995 [Ktedonobacteraceae bacterium]|nr:hypothetical protein [Ktedonobacteraceae bacterium]
MYYRVAIQRHGDQLDRLPSWQWTSPALSSLQSLFQVLRLYGALPQEDLRVFSSPSREDLEEQLKHENSGDPLCHGTRPHRSPGVRQQNGANARCCCIPG